MADFLMNQTVSSSSLLLGLFYQLKECKMLVFVFLGDLTMKTLLNSITYVYEPKKKKMENDWYYDTILYDRISRALKSCMTIGQLSVSTVRHRNKLKQKKNSEPEKS